MKYGISDDVIDEIKNVFLHHENIEKVLIFGSRAKGTYSEGSDIDLALVGKDIDYRQMLDISNDMENIGLLYKVDIMDYSKNIGTPIGEHIDRVGKVFYLKGATD